MAWLECWADCIPDMQNQGLLEVFEQVKSKDGLTKQGNVVDVEQIFRVGDGSVNDNNLCDEENPEDCD